MPVLDVVNAPTMLYSLQIRKSLGPQVQAVLGDAKADSLTMYTSSPTGMGTIQGPSVGAAIIMGVTFVVCVLLFRRGIVGEIEHRLGRGKA